MTKVENSSVIQPSAFSRSSLNQPSAISVLQFTCGAVLFVLLCTANGAGYRYGASDQAFYIPVVERALDGSLFPRDAALIDAEGRLMAVDEMLAGIARATGLSVPTLFLLCYLASMAVLWAGLALIGTHVYASPWAVLALGAAFSLRHRIPRTSANSFEPYFHPRMLAFGLGALAVAALLRRRSWLSVGLVAAASLVHITTGLWFAVLIGVALAVLDGRWRRAAIVGVPAAAAMLVAAATVGPLRGSLATMDATWLQAVASKDSLFATDWPVWAWTTNLGFLALLWWAHRSRARRGTASAEDSALVWGATALVALFLLTLPFVAAKVSLAVQFQVSRVFWLVDFIALVYVLAALVEPPGTPPLRSHPHGRLSKVHVMAAVLFALAAGRGAYVMLVERPERALFQVSLLGSPWEEAMQWIAAQPKDVHDPRRPWTRMEVRHERPCVGPARCAARGSQGFSRGDLLARRCGPVRRTQCGHRRLRRPDSREGCRPREALSVGLPRHRGRPRHADCLSQPAVQDLRAPVEDTHIHIRTVRTCERCERRIAFGGQRPERIEMLS